jgi:hypothetical protein
MSGELREWNSSLVLFNCVCLSGIVKLYLVDMKNRGTRGCC